MFINRIRDTREKRKNQKADTANVRYSYFDCLRDEVPIPNGPGESSLYRMLSAGCMTLFLFAVACLGRMGTGYFAQTH